MNFTADFEHRSLFCEKKKGILFRSNAGSIIPLYFSASRIITTISRQRIPPLISSSVQRAAASASAYGLEQTSSDTAPSSSSFGIVWSSDHRFFARYARDSNLARLFSERIIGVYPP